MKYTSLSILLLISYKLVQGVTIDVDTSRAPELADFGRRVKAALEDYYPKAEKLLQSPTFKPVSRINLFFDPNYDGAAYALGTKIVGSVKYYRGNQKDVGSMIHEMAHVIQGYQKCPTWITEGIADWVRYYNFEPNRKPSKPGPKANYKDGYGTSAFFLNWIESRWNRMIYYINKDCREGTYNDSIFPRLVGKNLDQLWSDMMKS